MAEGEKGEGHLTVGANLNQTFPGLEKEAQKPSRGMLGALVQQVLGTGTQSIDVFSRMGHPVTQEGGFENLGAAKVTGISSHRNQLAPSAQAGPSGGQNSTSYQGVQDGAKLEGEHARRLGESRHSGGGGMEIGG